MPVTPTTYPGVYIEEVPSGVRTITGVATSITAFIGRAARGPVNEPITINNFGDFGRIFGGVWAKSTLGFAVRDFFFNGGTQAIIVRLHKNATVAQINLPTSRALAEIICVRLRGFQYSVSPQYAVRTSKRPSSPGIQTPFRSAALHLQRDG